MTHTIGLKGKLLKQVITKSRYKKELKEALAFLAQIAEEAGLYEESKEKELKSVALLEEFIENRI